MRRQTSFRLCLRVLLWFDDFEEFLLQSWALFGRFNDPADLFAVDVEDYYQRKLINVECCRFKGRWRNSPFRGRVKRVFHETAENVDFKSRGFGYQSKNRNVLTTVSTPRSREGNYQVVVGELSQLIYSIGV